MEHHEYSSQKDIIAPASFFQQEASPTPLTAILERIARIKDPLTAQPGSQEFREKMEHPRWEIRATAARALGEFAAQEVPEELLMLLQDEHRMVRATAVRALGKFAQRLPAEDMPLEYVLLALRDAAWEMREMAVLVLGELRTYPTEPLLRSALWDSNSYVRDAAQYALSNRQAFRSTQ